MHELTVAVNIVQIVNDEVKERNISKVDEMVLDVGEMAGIDFEALDFALQEAVRNSPLERTRITINKIEARAKCMECGHEFAINDFLSNCPECGNFQFDIIKGKELKIKSLTVEKDDD